MPVRRALDNWGSDFCLKLLSISSSDLITIFIWEVPSPFHLVPTSGLLEPGAVCTVKVLFQPQVALAYDVMATCRFGDDEEQNRMIQLRASGEAAQGRPYLELQGGCRVRGASGQGCHRAMRPCCVGPVQTSNWAGGTGERAGLAQWYKHWKGWSLSYTGTLWVLPTSTISLGQGQSVQRTVLSSLELWGVPRGKRTAHGLASGLMQGPRS